VASIVHGQRVRALLQRTSGASVRVGGEPLSSIGPGLVVLLGVGHDDDANTADGLAERIAQLRIFRDEEGRTNRSLIDVRGEALVVSQFTLFADTSRGRRPGFTGAAGPEQAERLYSASQPLCASTTFASRRVDSGRRWRWSS